MAYLERKDLLGFVLLILLLVLIMTCPTGCASIQPVPADQSLDELISTPKADFWQHDTIWASGDHFWYSIYGYRNNSVKDYFQSKNEGWWGEPVELKRPFKTE